LRCRNNLIATTHFFVVLPSFVITLNPRDWRGPMATRQRRETGAPLFASGSLRTIRIASTRREFARSTRRNSAAFGEQRERGTRPLRRRGTSSFELTPLGK
jgi:hypothetical protein